MRWILAALLLLIGTLVGVSLSYIATSAAPASKKRESPFTYLEVHDTSLVHVRRGTNVLLTDWDYEPADLLSWQLHLPKGKAWRLCWAFGKFPRDGEPTTPAGTHLLPATEPDQAELRITFFVKDKSEWRTSFSYAGVPPNGYDTWLVSVPSEQGPDIWHASQSFATAAGEENKTDGWIAQTFSGEKPIALLRLGKANMDGFGRHDPYNGILVWLEQASESSNTEPEGDGPRRE